MRIIVPATILFLLFTIALVILVGLVDTQPAPEFERVTIHQLPQPIYCHFPEAP